MQADLTTKRSVQNTCLPVVADAFSYNVDLVGGNTCSANGELRVLCYPAVWKHYLSSEVALRDTFGGWLDKVCDLLWWRGAKPGKPCPSQRPEGNGSAEGGEKGRELPAAPHRAQPRGVRLAHPTHSARPSRAAFALVLSRVGLQVTCWTSAGVLITRLGSLWVCPCGSAPLPPVLWAE